MVSSEAVERIEAAAWRVARRHFEAQALRPSVLARAALELSSIYTAERQQPPAPASCHLPARLLFFTLTELPKWLWPLAELEIATASRLAGRDLKVLDLGAGCGAASLGLLAFCATAGASTRLRVEAVDRDRAALELFRDLADELRADPAWPSFELDTNCHDLGRALLEPSGRQSYDLVLIGNLLNELPPADQSSLLEKALAQLAPGGAVVIVEPALRVTSRTLHELRDRLVANSTATVLAPCVHAEPCPALTDPNDWCHESRLWTPPPLLRELCTQSGLRRRELRFCYLALGVAGQERMAARPAGAWRVVSEPLVSKGKRELFLCGRAGRRRVVLLNRHRSGANQSFGDLRRGQLCWIEQADERCTELRLSAQSRVEAVDPGAWTECSGDG